MRKSFLFLACLSFLAFTITLQAQEATFPERLGERLDLAGSTGQLQAAGEPIVETGLVMTLYEQGGFQPIWTVPETIPSLMHWIDRAWGEGLTPDDYHRDVISRLMELEKPSLQQRIDEELLLSDALLQLVLHLRTGKADPMRLFETWNYQPDFTGFPGIGQILAAVKNNSIDELLATQLPRMGVYPALREALEKYRRIREAGGWKPIAVGPALHPGDKEKRVQDLRERLRMTGELSGDPPDSVDFYDSDLERAVRLFQRRHLLDVDGVVGRRTLAALNIPVEQKIQQIRINMERLRWLNHGIPDEFIGVDLAGFNAYHWQKGTVTWSSAVQVGKPYHQTPIFRDMITYIDINPTWTVPTSITRKELAPQLLQAPLDYLRKNNMELLTPGGDPVDPSSVDWKAIRPRNFPYVLRQRPGPENALGRIKFMFPNKYHVYLHDTPSRYLFTRTRRAFSHGCIRLRNPLELGEILLSRNRQPWSRKRLEEVIATGKSRTVILDHPMPILIIYLTAAPNVDDLAGSLEFRPDIYNRDEKVLEALDGPVNDKGSRLLESL